jgi:hypothetical protein
MIITENRELTRLILDHLTQLYGLTEKRVGIHLSSLIFCLKRQQMDTLDGRVLPTDKELMLFALGWGLQDVLTPHSAETPVIEKEGIIYRPDFNLTLQQWTCELKTTRMSMKKGDAHEFPETWIKYMKGGCYMQNRNTYDLAVLYMMGYYKPPFPEAASYHFEFTDDEILDNWDWIKSRYDIYVPALQSGVILPAYTYNEEWECENCRYELVCSSEKMLKKEGKLI